MNYPEGYQIVNMAGITPTIPNGGEVEVTVTPELKRRLFAGQKPLLVANLCYTDDTTPAAIISGIGLVTESGAVRTVHVGGLAITDVSTDTETKIKFAKE